MSRKSTGHDLRTGTVFMMLAAFAAGLPAAAQDIKPTTEVDPIFRTGRRPV